MNLKMNDFCPCYYRGTHQDSHILKNSSSGGAFSAISDVWFSLNHGRAAVYGAIFDDQLKVKHVRAESKEQRDEMRGSKYIQSNMADVFISIENDLGHNMPVLFTGTPCQVSAIMNYCNIKKLNTDLLFTVDLICHGVASSRFFYDYIHHLEKKYAGKAVKCKFRGKNKPYKRQDMEVTFDNGKKYEASSTKYDWFYSVYLKNLILRPVCYSCPFAKEERISDISIADYWEKGKNDSESLVIVNTTKGKELWNEIDQFENQQIDRKSVNQPQLIKPCIKPINYDLFWKEYNSQGYLAAQKIVGNNTIKGKIKSLIIDVTDRIGLIGYIKQKK